jgi:hypothetical protein
MNAAACNQVDVVKVLLEAGADKDARDVVRMCQVQSRQKSRAISVGFAT